MIGLSDAEANTFRGFASQIWGLTYTCHQSCLSKLTFKKPMVSSYSAWRQRANLFKGALDDRRRKSTQGGQRVLVLLRILEMKRIKLFLGFSWIVWPCTDTVPVLLFLPVVFMSAIFKMSPIWGWRHMYILDIFSWSNNSLRRTCLFFKYQLYLINHLT